MGLSKRYATFLNFFEAARNFALKDCRRQQLRVFPNFCFLAAFPLKLVALGNAYRLQHNRLNSMINPACGVAESIIRQKPAVFAGSY